MGAGKVVSVIVSSGFSVQSGGPYTTCGSSVGTSVWMTVCVVVSRLDVVVFPDVAAMSDAVADSSVVVSAVDTVAVEVTAVVSAADVDGVVSVPVWEVGTSEVTGSLFSSVTGGS